MGVRLLELRAALFIFIAGFLMLNLFIGVIIDSMMEMKREVRRRRPCLNNIVRCNTRSTTPAIVADADCQCHPPNALCRGASTHPRARVQVEEKVTEQKAWAVASRLKSKADSKDPSRSLSPTGEFANPTRESEFSGG